MNKRDQAELRRRFKKEQCTISRIAGCYVDGYKNKVLTFNENFLNLEDEEFYKYLEIAKKTLGGTIGNNILEMDFDASEESGGGRQQFYMGLRESELKNDDLLDRLYDMVIENYVHTGNFLILVFNDAYDIMSRTSDNMKLDESEEVYRYILVSICPVDLSKAGLGYREDEHRIGARRRDWVVGAPDTGFLFPAFDDRSQNIHRVDYFVRDAKDSHPEFIEEVLGTGVKRTATELKTSFQAIVKSAFPKSEEQAKAVLTDITESINNRVEEYMADAEAGVEASSDHMELNGSIIDEILKENELEEQAARTIKESCLDEFADQTPLLSDLVNKKELDKGIEERRKNEIIKENMALKAQLSVTNSGNGVIIKVPEEIRKDIYSEVIDSRRYVLIPVEADEPVILNGQEITL